MIMKFLELPLKNNMYFNAPYINIKKMHRELPV